MPPRARAKAKTEEKAPEAQAGTPVQEAKPTTVTKDAFKERALAYLETVEVGLSKKVAEIKSVKVQEGGEAKIDMAFIVFDFDDEENNINLMKKVCWNFMIADELKGNKPIYISIMDKHEGDPYILSYQEYDVNVN